MLKQAALLDKGVIQCFMSDTSSDKAIVGLSGPIVWHTARLLALLLNIEDFESVH